MSQRMINQGLWITLGWALIIGVNVLSLIRMDQPLQVSEGDKIGHVLAYAALMYWWGMVMPGRKYLWAIGLALMGVLLEYIQSFLPYRYMDWQDAAANTTGIVTALLLLLTPASRLLAYVDRLLGNRFNSG